MILYGDYHTHTTFSHGKGSVLENATVAARKGLKEIAITDHGFNHQVFGLRPNKMDRLRQEVEEATKATGVNVLLGVESNFTSLDGTIDINPKQLNLFDIILCGHHYFVRALKTSDKLGLFVPNYFSKIWTSKAQIEKTPQQFCEQWTSIQ